MVMLRSAFPAILLCWTAASYTSLEPAQTASRLALSSGPPIGAESPSFDPQHVAGPDKGSHACPMCKYGHQAGVLVWVNTDELAGTAILSRRLEWEIRERGAQWIRAFIIYMNPEGRPISEVRALLTAFSERAALTQVAVTYVPSPTDEKSSRLYGINPDPSVKNTVIVYLNRTVFDKFVNLGVDEESLDRLMKSVDRAHGTPRT